MTQPNDRASSEASGPLADAEAAGPALLILTPEGETTDSSQTITGSFGAGAGPFDPTGRTVEIDDGGVKVGTATVASDGTWSAPVLLSHLGANVLTATASGDAGQAVASAPVVLTLETVLSPVSGGTPTIQPTAAAAVHRPARGATAWATEAADVFVFEPHPGHATIEGFSPSGVGHDALSFSSRSFASMVDILHHTAMSGGDAVIHLSPTDSVRLGGVSKADLRAGRGALVLHG